MWFAETHMFGVPIIINGVDVVNMNISFAGKIPQ